ncbi:ROK family protein [Cellulomonas pakistanensis]|uniref:Transcriptional regulator n=1 Tax=Cellulomonas pakistanensis TaxID=992287 RepID=A0A919PAE8_9CELL|nr:ROK family protein [Cellulomonas pakistanensis]GIG36001.1 transcriptional regulator [Cellulomonas pakistanensis]
MTSPADPEVRSAPVPARRGTRPDAAPRDSRGLLLAALRREDGLTQVELCRATGLAPATVSAAVAALAAEGLVRVSATTRSGRRATRVQLAHGGALVGVHCYLDEVRVVLDRGDGEPVEAVVPLPGGPGAGQRAEHAVRAARALLDRVLRDSGTDPAAVAAVGVGVPAPVEVRTGRVAGAGVRAGWGGMVAAPALLAPAPGVPVLFDNDGNLGALAEARVGAGRGRRTVVHVALGEGVSGGIVVAGDVVHGRTGTAGELGHLTIDPDGPVCTCGNRGCLQVLAGASAVLELLAASHGPLTVPELLALAAAGDPGCRRVLSDVGRHLGTALASVCTVLDPDVLVVGGALAAAGDVLLDPLREVLAERTAVTAGAVVDVVAGRLGAGAPARGALLLARDAVLAGAAG